MSVTLVHYLDTKISTVEDISPRVNVVTRFVKNRLVEVETVKVECHSSNTKRGEPDTNYRPSCKEEVKRTGVVEGSILEDKTTEICVCCRDGISLILLTEYVTVVKGLRTSSLCKERRGYKRTVHCGEERTTEDTCYTKNVERMHEDLVLSLEDKHEVESTLDTKWHTIGEGTLTDWVNNEHCSCCRNWSGECYEDPWTHTETIGEFPFTTHPTADTEEEVEHNELISTTVVEPFIKTKGFPERIEMDTDCVRRRNNSTRDDVVTIDKGTCNWLTDTINIDCRSKEESSDISYGSKGEKWEDEETEPTDIKTVRGRSDCLNERTPGVRANKACHNRYGKRFTLASLTRVRLLTEAPRYQEGKRGYTITAHHSTTCLPLPLHRHKHSVRRGLNTQTI
mmetsp:Transcript_47819/g.107337  ORF Transcript_47819/g.107337 Transcript_47819/m.107337 type:complete len:396 (+) Transcript_47819:127-1314(+)